MSEISPTRFYTLAQARSLTEYSSGSLVHLAAAAQIDLCVIVPSGSRAFTVDPTSVLTWDEKTLSDRLVNRAHPNRDWGVPVRKDEVVALVLDWTQCGQLFDYGLSRQIFFRTAYAIQGFRNFEFVPAPVQVRPIRMPLYQGDGRTPTDQSRWRFALYPHKTQFTYVDGAGYQEPDDLVLTLDTLRVLGSELSRLPKLIDLVPENDELELETPTDSQRPAPQKGSTSIAVQVDEPVSPPTPHEGRRGEPVVQMVQESAPPEGVDKHDGLKTEVIREDRGPVKLLKREEVEPIIKKGKSWIYERMTAGHPNFDPSFPQPLRIGKSVLWIEAEVRAWWSKQVEEARRK